MTPPIWLEVCSCGQPTGAVFLCASRPACGLPLPGHEAHHTRVVTLAHAGPQPLTADQHRRLAEADDVFRGWWQ